MKNKIKLLIFLLLVIPFLGACSLNKEKVNMDELQEDGKYHYRNDLGFSLALPADFVYFQTQRRIAEDYTDVEIFVPTTDVDYPQELSGYGKPVVIRIFTKENWEGKEDLYEKIGVSGDKVFTIRFWRVIPNDWTDKWNEEREREIKNGFKLID